MDEELAADLSQEIFIKFFGSVSKWRHHCNIAAWLFLVARRHCIDYFRKRKRYESFYGSVPVCEEQVFYSADNRPNYCYDEWRDEKTIELFLEKLTSLERMLLEIRFLGGYSFEEIYLIFGISKSNAAKMMNRALDKIYLFYEGKG